MRGSVCGNAIYLMRSVVDPDFSSSPDFDADFLEHCKWMFNDDIQKALEKLKAKSGLDYGMDYQAWDTWHKDLTARQIREEADE